MSGEYLVSSNSKQREWCKKPRAWVVLISQCCTFELFSFNKWMQIIHNSVFSRRSWNKFLFLRIFKHWACSGCISMDCALLAYVRSWYEIDEFRGNQSLCPHIINNIWTIANFRTWVTSLESSPTVTKIKIDRETWKTSNFQS